MIVRALDRERTEAERPAAAEHLARPSIHPVLSVLESQTIRDLPLAVKRFHGADSQLFWRGRASVVTGKNPIARLICLLIGFPRTGNDQALLVSVRRQKDPSGNSLVETWTRDFPDRRYRSNLFVDRKGQLHERMGFVDVSLDVGVDDRSLVLRVSRWKLFGVPMPLFLGPLSRAGEFQDEQGRFCFDVRVSHKIVGLFISYQGWLEPVCGEAIGYG